MSEDNNTTSGNESHLFQARGPDFDCTVIIEQVIEQTSAKHANTRPLLPMLWKNYSSK